MQGIDNIISNCINQIDAKIKGVNFLEKLKYSIIDEFKSFNFLDFSKTNALSHKINNENKTFMVEITKFNENFSKIKKILENEKLYITLNGSKKIIIKDKVDSLKSNEVFLPRLTGLVLAKNCTFDEVIIKDSIILSISLVENNETVII